jgi:hypothetical protein
VYRIALDASRRHAPTDHRVDSDDAARVVECRSGERLTVEFPGQATFDLSRDEVVLRVDDADDTDLTAHLLLDQVIPRVVSLRGDVMLHAAGAVGPSGRAHVFLGDSGAGKSTLGAALAAAGWALLDDDGIRVIRAADGSRHAVPGYRGVRLWADAAAAFLPNVPPGRPMVRNGSKFRFAVDGHHMRMADGRAPLGAVYVLQRAEGVRVSAERMGLADAVTALVQHSFHFADSAASITRQAFERAASLASAIPIFQLTHPAGLERIVETVSYVSELDEQ